MENIDSSAPCFDERKFEIVLQMTPQNGWSTASISSPVVDAILELHVNPENFWAVFPLADILKVTTSATWENLNVAASVTRKVDFVLLPPKNRTF